MLIIYEKKTGKIVSNQGTIQSYPEGFPDESIVIDALLPQIGGARKDYAAFRLHDERDAATVQKAMTHRGTIEDGKIVFHEEIEIAEVPLPNEDSIEGIKNRVLLMEEKTSSPTEQYDKSDKVAMKLEEIKKVRVLKLKEECSNSIYNGFISDSTGHVFGFNDLDQANFTQRMLTIVAGSKGPFSWKAKDVGVISLTKEEFMLVIQEAEAHKLRKQERYWALEKKVLLATSNQEVDQILW